MICMSGFTNKTNLQSPKEMQGPLTVAPDMPSLRMHITIQNGVKEKE